MSEPQDQDSATDFQASVQKALNAPDFAEKKAKYLAFFQEDAAQFERKVPSDRIIKVKRIFKLIKEIDLPAFKLLKSMRTAIGLLDESERDTFHQSLKDIREGLHSGILTASAAHALIYLVVLEPFQRSYQNSLIELKSEVEDEPEPNYFVRAAQNPQILYRTRCFVYAYLLLLDDCDPAHWSIVARGEEHPRVDLDQTWFLASVQLKMIDLFSCFLT